jgi:hypothetical protein
LGRGEDEAALADIQNDAAVAFTNLDISQRDVVPASVQAAFGGTSASRTVLRFVEHNST